MAVVMPGKPNDITSQKNPVEVMSNKKILAVRDCHCYVGTVVYPLTG